MNKSSDTAEANVTKENIAHGLTELGLSRGDCVLVHSSLSSFGHVVGGADSVIDALLETVGAEGTVTMPTFTWGEFHAANSGEFDVRKTPSECGRVTEMFWRRPQAVRGTHMCHSLAAIGKHAADMVHDTPSPYAPGSGFDHLLRLNAWNLFIGVDFTSCTTLHLVEERMQVPYRAFRAFHGCTVVHAEGRRSRSNSVEFLRKTGVFNDLAKMNRVLAEAGVVRSTHVGNARLMNVRMRHIVEVTTECLARDILFLTMQ
jgi:aminoglycoside 3-N-acetyltransferase